MKLIRLILVLALLAASLVALVPSAWAGGPYPKDVQVFQVGDHTCVLSPVDLECFCPCATCVSAPTDQPPGQPTVTPTETPEPTDDPKCNKGGGNGSEGCDPGNNPDKGHDDEKK